MDGLTVPTGAPEEVGVSAARLNRVRDLLTTAVAASVVPGAVAAAARGSRLVLYEAYGMAALHPAPRPMAVDTLFDLASLTKVVATLPCLLGLVEEGLLYLDEPVARLLPAFAAGGKENVTYRHVLTHTAGLVWWRDYFRRGLGYEEIIAAICAEDLTHPPGTKVVYSDLGFILLTEILRRLTGKPLDTLAAERVFRPLGMAGAVFNPAGKAAETAAATEYRPERGACQCGEVHDENALAMGGVSGHAGLFATALDVLRYGQAWLGGGALPGAGRILSPATVAAATREETAGMGERRGLGWALRTPSGSPAGDLFSPDAYGHTGFTGTSLWIDPRLGLTAVLLTNRVHPGRENKALFSLRPRFHNLLAAAVEDSPSSSRGNGAVGGHPRA